MAISKPYPKRRCRRRAIRTQLVTHVAACRRRSGNAGMAFR
jgi:hypothetical protein